MGLPYHGGPDGFRPARACRTRYARGRGSRRAGAAPEGRAMSGHRGRAMAALVGVLLLAGTAGGGAGPPPRGGGGGRGPGGEPLPLREPLDGTLGVPPDLGFRDLKLEAFR